MSNIKVTQKNHRNERLTFNVVPTWREIRNSLDVVQNQLKGGYRPKVILRNPHKQAFETGSIQHEQLARCVQRSARLSKPMAFWQIPAC
jgi:hypothetical protein